MGDAWLTGCRVATGRIHQSFSRFCQLALLTQTIVLKKNSPNISQPKSANQIHSQTLLIFFPKKLLWWRVGAVLLFPKCSQTHWSGLTTANHHTICIKSEFDERKNPEGWQYVSVLTRTRIELYTCPFQFHRVYYPPISSTKRIWPQDVHQRWGLRQFTDFPLEMTPFDTNFTCVWPVQDVAREPNRWAALDIALKVEYQSPVVGWWKFGGPSKHSISMCTPEIQDSLQQPCNSTANAAVVFSSGY